MKRVKSEPVESGPASKTSRKKESSKVVPVTSAVTRNHAEGNIMAKNEKFQKRFISDKPQKPIAVKIQPLDMDAVRQDRVSVVLSRLGIDAKVVMPAVKIKMEPADKDTITKKSEQRMNVPNLPGLSKIDKYPGIAITKKLEQRTNVPNLPALSKIKKEPADIETSTKKWMNIMPNLPGLSKIDKYPGMAITKKLEQRTNVPNLPALSKIKKEPVDIETSTKKSEQWMNIMPNLPGLSKIKKEPTDVGTLTKTSELRMNVPNLPGLSKIKKEPTANMYPNKSEQLMGVPILVRLNKIKKEPTADMETITKKSEQRIDVVNLPGLNKIKKEPTEQILTKNTGRASYSAVPQSKIKVEPIEWDWNLITNRTRRVAKPLPSSVKVKIEPRDVTLLTQRKKDEFVKQQKAMKSKVETMDVDTIKKERVTDAFGRLGIGKKVASPVKVKIEPGEVGISTKKKGQRCDLVNKRQQKVNVKQEPMDVDTKKKGNSRSKSASKSSAQVKVESTEPAQEDKKPNFSGNKELDALLIKKAEAEKQLAALEQGIYDCETEIFRESGPFGNILNLFGDGNGPRRRTIRSNDINPAMRLASLSSSTAHLHVPEFAAKLQSEREKEQNIASSSAIKAAECRRQNRKRK